MCTRDVTFHREPIENRFKYVTIQTCKNVEQIAISFFEQWGRCVYWRKLALAAHQWRARGGAAE